MLFKIMFDVYISSLDDYGDFQDHVESINGVFRNLAFHIYLDLIVDFILNYTANFFPMKNTGTGHDRVPAGFPHTIYGKGL